MEKAGLPNFPKRNRSVPSGIRAVFSMSFLPVAGISAFEQAHFQFLFKRTAVSGLHIICEIRRFSTSKKRQRLHGGICLSHSFKARKRPWRQTPPGSPIYFLFLIPQSVSPLHSADNPRSYHVQKTCFKCSVPLVENFKDVLKGIILRRRGGHVLFCQGLGHRCALLAGRFLR